jgi:hypothetical protein
MKAMVRTILALVPAVMVAGGAHALGLKPGLYNADGIQQMCLLAGGTWTSPTFPGWGGKWQVTGANTHIWGNYASGAGNDSLVIKGKGGTWMEWRDDLSFNNPLDPISFVKIGRCKAASAAPVSHKGNPAEK